MDLQGILQLTMTTEPQVDFVFNTIQKYQVGITKYNATRLEVEPTVPWDLYAQPSTEFWTQQIAYGAGANGQGTLPSEILEMQPFSRTRLPLRLPSTASSDYRRMPARTPLR